jgi:hypothetical protein
MWNCLNWHDSKLKGRGMMKKKLLLFMLTACSHSNNQHDIEGGRSETGQPAFHSRHAIARTDG